MQVYNEIKIEPSSLTKSEEQKKIEHELVCLMNSHRPDKSRIKELKKKLRSLLRK